MATPTPMKHAHSQQGRTPSQFAAATPPVSTPFSNAAQAAFSPRGPKSSPQHVKKSPATSSLMAQTGLGAFNFDSPSTAAAMGALGMSGTFDIGLDTVGVAGLDAIGVALANEDDKLKRLDNILNLLSTKKGLVSEASLERLAQRVGLELLSEEQRTPGGRKTRTLAIAGSAIALDIVLDNNIVQSVSLSYHGSAPSVAKHMDAAGQILLRDLTLLPGQSPLTKSLESFARNFERLAGLDKLSIVPGLDCHEALAGIFTSLRRLYDWDLSQLREEPANKIKSEHLLSNLVMCSKHGRPVLHDRNIVGLAIQYWRQYRFESDATADLDDYGHDRDTVWSMLLGCAPLVNLSIPPVRVSENWISENVTKENTALEPERSIPDWQEPENVSLPQSEDNKDAGMDMLQPDLSSMRVPRVMFTVTFNPPVVLPQNDWARLYMYANTTPPNINTELGSRGHPLTPPTFDSLLFPVESGVKTDPSEPRSVARRRRVRVFGKDGKSEVKDHTSTLLIYKPIYSQTVSEMPFSHPRQLLDMLPLLRQYAFLSLLLENSFGVEKPRGSDESPPKPDSSPAVPQHTFQTRMLNDKQSDFLDLEQPSADAEPPVESFISEASSACNMTVTLWVHPSPHIQVIFPMSLSPSSATADITLKIQEGGTVEIIKENVLDRRAAAAAAAAEAGDGARSSREQLAGVLEYFEDLGKWAEWIRSRLT